MISASELALVGKVNKTHGVKGELSISFFIDSPQDSIEVGDCLVMDIDGIFTPFFVASVRSRSAEALLIAFDDVDSQEEASQFVGKNVYFVGDEDSDDSEDEDGMYAGQLIGFKAMHINDAGKPELIGEIIDIDDATDNVLFIVELEDGKTAYIPVADELITEISQKNKAITFDLPTGLLTL